MSYDLSTRLGRRKAQSYAQWLRRRSRQLEDKVRFLKNRVAQLQKRLDETAPPHRVKDPKTGRFIRSAQWKP